MTRQTKALCKKSMLTASFGAAEPPLIWRFDLERNHSFTLALQGENSDWDLGVTSPKGEFYHVAHFGTREDADEAFASIEKALSCHRSTWATVARALAIVVILAFVMATGIAGFGYYVNHRSQSSPVNDIKTGGPSVSEMPEGVPLPADQVLHVPSL